jgi:hypothetical protein
MKALLRLCLPLAAFALAVGCGGDQDESNASKGPALGGDGDVGTCQDVDGDGFGVHCAEGPDCDDGDDTVFEECGHCTVAAEGCECDANSPAIECKLSPEQIVKDSLLCETGMRYCREGVWTACISVATFH